jgi:hypothetical protein
VFTFSDRKGQNCIQKKKQMGFNLQQSAENQERNTDVKSSDRLTEKQNDFYSN